MKILILGTCTSRKNNVNKPTPAIDVYDGPQHNYIVKAYDKLKEAGVDIDYYIISAKYGLINALNYKIKPYNVTFADKTQEEIEKMSDKLNIDEKLEKLLPKYDMVFWTLSEPYMDAIQETLDKIDNLGNTANIFFIPKSFLKDYPTIEDEDYIILKDSDTKKYKAGKVMLKGKYFLILADILTKDVPTLESLKKIKSNPEYIEELVKKYYKKNRIVESFDYKIEYYLV